MKQDLLAAREYLIGKLNGTEMREDIVIMLLQILVKLVDDS